MPTPVRQYQRLKPQKAFDDLELKDGIIRVEPSPFFFAQEPQLSGWIDPLWTLDNFDNEGGE